MRRDSLSVISVAHPYKNVPPRAVHIRFSCAEGTLYMRLCEPHFPRKSKEVIFWQKRMICCLAWRCLIASRRSRVSLARFLWSRAALQSLWNTFVRRAFIARSTAQFLPKWCECSPRVSRWISSPCLKPQRKRKFSLPSRRQRCTFPTLWKSCPPCATLMHTSA